jgi:hypothetical protein
VILRSDDDIYIVDQRWYGPPGKELPWHARYPAYGWGFALYVIAMLVERVVLRIGLGFQSILFTLMATCIATTYIMRKVDPDRPLLTVLRGYWHELRTPRPKGESSAGAGRGGKPQRLQLAMSRPPRGRTQENCPTRRSDRSTRGVAEK